MTIIYTLLGVPYVAVLDPVRGVVLQKAARKRIPSPGQMSLFAGNEPKEGDTKVENGVTYRLNQNSRWERTDKAKGTTKAKPKAVVPVVEEKREEPTPEPMPGQADLAKIPPSVASKLRASFGTVKAWNQRVDLARQTDQQFQGGGRYTWEATNGTQMEEPETIRMFREMAPKNGVDADAALAAMGYEPPTQLMPSEMNESNVTQRNATPEPTPVAAEPNFEVVSDRASQPPGTIFYDDPAATPEQKAWMEYGGQNYIPATIATRSEIDNTFPDVAQAAAEARKYGYQGADDYEVLARYMAGGAARNVGSQNVYPVYFEDEPTPVAAEPAKAEVRPITEIGDDFIDSPPPHDPEFRKTHGPIKRSDISYIGQDPKTGLYRIMVSGEQYTFEAVPGSGKNFRHLDGDNKIVARNYKTFRNKLGISGGSSAASALINAIKPSFSASTSEPTSEPTPVAAEVVVDEPKPKQRLGDRMRAIAQELRQETEAQKQYTARMLGAAAQLAQNQDNLIDEVVDMVNEDLDTPEALPEPTIGDMLAEQKAEEEAGGMEKQSVSGRELASIIAEKIPSIYSRTAGNLKAFVWTKKENETRVYLKTYKGKDAGYISIRHSDGYITDNSNWADIEPQVDQLLDAILEEYEASPDSQNSNSANSQPGLEGTQTANEEAQRKLAAMSREEVDSAIREWRYKMDDDDKYEQALESERKIAKEIGVPSDAIRGGQVVLKMLPEDMLRSLAAKLLP